MQRFLQTTSARPSFLSPAIRGETDTLQIDNVERPRTHLVGCCGSGMQGLANLLMRAGHQVSGSDISPPNNLVQQLMRKGFEFSQKQLEERLPENLSQLVYSQAIRHDHPERMAARRHDIPEFSYNEMVARLLRDHRGVCIAGTHGKSTTTALTAWVLRAAGQGNSALFGAELCDIEHRGTDVSSWSGTGELFVVESCEFQRSFLDYHPAYAAVLSVEPDHFDCFASIDDLVEAYARFCSQVANTGFLLLPQTDLATTVLRNCTAARTLTFGGDSRADWWADAVQPIARGLKSGGMKFRVHHQGREVVQLESPLPGHHNVQNALVAVAICSELGLTAEQIRQGISSFPGICRRFEVLGNWQDVTVVTDYAHHPTAIRATLATARQQFPNRRLRVAFQPHQISRTTALFAEFVSSFELADEVWLPPVFAARERGGLAAADVSARLAGAISDHGVLATPVLSLDHLEQVVEDALQPGDVFLIMGAGDIDRIQYVFTRRLH